MAEREIVTDDILADGVSPTEVAELKSFLEERLKGVAEVKKVYLTPAAAFSDHCAHKAHKSVKCQINGVAYQIGPNTRLDKIINSHDLLGSVAFYEVSSFGSDIDAMIKLDPEGAIKEIEREFADKQLDVRSVVKDMFVSKVNKTAPHIFDGYEDGDFNRESLLELKKSVSKIAGHNGFVYLGRYRDMVDRKPVSKVLLAVRSFDEISSLQLFEEIHVRKPTVEEFKNSTEFIRLRQQARKNTAIHQGHVAHRIINEVLGWKTSAEPVHGLFGSEDVKVKYIPTDVRFDYNVLIAREDEGYYIYHDHVFSVEDVIKHGFYPFLKGRADGMCLLVPTKGEHNPIMNAGKWEPRLVALPMGPRKLKHRSQYTIDEQMDEGGVVSELTFDHTKLTLTNQQIMWYGQGARNYKLVKGKYSSRNVGRLFSQVYKVSEKNFEVVEVDTWLSDFGQEFDQNPIGTSIVDVFLLTEESEPLVISMEQDFYKEEFSSLILYAARNGIKLHGKGGVVLGQNTSRLMLLLDKGIVRSYLKSK